MTQQEIELNNIDDGGKDFATGSPYQGGHYGMSLRDYFAAAALPQAVEDYGSPASSGNDKPRSDRGNAVLPYATEVIGNREGVIARQAYRYADAMIIARKT